MFEVAFAIGIFSYSIFFLGLLGLLYQPIIIGYTMLYWLLFIIWDRHTLLSFLGKFRHSSKNLILFIGIIYLIIQACINVVGLFGPEIGFDAMWYHLTLPKLFLLYHTVLYIPGVVFLYSTMPHLTEMLYTVGLSFGSDFWARGVHFIFGILDCIVVYKIGRKFLSPAWAILLPIIFYSNLVVGWESISGYIDLSRTFFTITALLAFLQWIEKKQQKYFIYSALLVGLTVSTKLLALPDIALYSVVFFLFERKTVTLYERLKRIAFFAVLAILPCLPWFIFSFVHTGNPVFPMLSSYYQVSGYWQDVLNPLSLVRFVWDTFARSPDPIHPLFLAMIPFIILFWKKLWREVPLIVMFSLGGFLIWYVTPQTGGGRYILPYLPIFSLLCVFIIHKLSGGWQKVFLIFIALVASISLVYRAGAVAKFLPVITGKETKAHFIANHLQYNLGDFYDVDGYFSKHIKPTDTVLLFGFHNLYYINFPYILSDWVQKGDRFTYVAVQGTGMPERFKYWNLVYFNTQTQVRLYSLGNQTWQY